MPKLVRASSVVSIGCSEDGEAHSPARRMLAGTMGDQTPPATPIETPDATPQKLQRVGSADSAAVATGSVNFCGSADITRSGAAAADESELEEDMPSAPAAGTEETLKLCQDKRHRRTTPHANVHRSREDAIMRCQACRQGLKQAAAAVGTRGIALSAYFAARATEAKRVHQMVDLLEDDVALEDGAEESTTAASPSPGCNPDGGAEDAADSLPAATRTAVSGQKRPLRRERSEENAASADESDASDASDSEGSSPAPPRPKRRVRRTKSEEEDFEPEEKSNLTFYGLLVKDYGDLLKEERCVQQKTKAKTKQGKIAKTQTKTKKCKTPSLQDMSSLPTPNRGNQAAKASLPGLPAGCIDVYRHRKVLQGFSPTAANASGVYMLGAALKDTTEAVRIGCEKMLHEAFECEGSRGSITRMVGLRPEGLGPLRSGRRLSRAEPVAVVGESWLVWQLARDSHGGEAVVGAAIVSRSKKPRTGPEWLKGGATLEYIAVNKEAGGKGFHLVAAAEELCRSQGLPELFSAADLNQARAMGRLTGRFLRVRQFWERVDY
eukprot:TRINITY_DN28303_c0_g1_i2.p1 TRINITY_DN28303_c0_g1~~TRINITY_DN28303_c0_g1_i2.p1  ORF type:complete len:552 (+),score=137.00 TRINITY_DN28303_c0_g1_i2:63-1718(+)